jgi:hypothetical protein
VFAQGDAPRGFIGGLAGATVHEQTGGVLGGQAGIRAAGNLHVIGEAGWMRNVLPGDVQADIDIVSALLGLGGSPDAIDARLQALYGFGGLRWSPVRGRVAPFIESGFGAARLTLHVDAAAGSDVSGAIEDDLRDATEATKPLFVAAGGLNVALGGPFRLDAGYRYARIFTDEPAIHAHAVYGAVKVAF